ncbi:hypothetical protein EDD34_0031 [Myceligenerans xiligouense]|uniref:Uncharacterized protein n=1 Tax=Myceligenerans xiligouense TaxID=253184 RepID=A0A3N4YF99_9MICO|nr:hypothetical protein EDD34_0031 [Myceligenerans xiligouense]
MVDEPELETAKFYTRARRIPMLVGKMPSGGRIWGGPYTITQIGAGALVGFVLWKTAPLWAQLGGFMNVLVAAGVVVGTVWLTGKIPSTGRNPATWVMDAMNLTTSPGRLSGGRLAIARPRRISHRVMVLLPDGDRAAMLARTRGWTGADLVPVDDVDRREVATGTGEMPLPPLTPTDLVHGDGRDTASLTGVGELLAGKLRRKDG